MADQIIPTMEDIEAKLKSLPEFKRPNKFVHLYSAEEFLDVSHDLSPPFAAVVYEGAAPNHEEKGGMANDLLFGIYVVSSRDRSTEDVVGAIDLLWEIRNVIKLKFAPTGHQYIYRGEVQFDIGTGLGYIQRWSTNAMFTN